MNTDEIVTVEVIIQLQGFCSIFFPFYRFWLWGDFGRHAVWEQGKNDWKCCQEKWGSTCTSDTCADQ